MSGWGLCDLGVQGLEIVEGFFDPASEAIRRLAVGFLGMEDAGEGFDDPAGGHKLKRQEMMSGAESTRGREHLAA